MIKNKGSIVPRWLLKAEVRKSQHQFKFGCDVEIDGYTVRAKSGTGSCIVHIPNRKYCNLKKNKGTQKRKVKGWTTNPKLQLLLLTDENNE